MSRLFKVQSRMALVAYCALVCGLVVTTSAQAARNAQSPNMSGDASRMVFKENKKNKKEHSCQLTLMHVYTSKFNKKHTQFAFTGSVIAKREKGKDMVLTVVGQNHQLTPGGKDVKPFPIPRIELGVEDVSVRRYSEHKQKCKKGHVCAEYKDTKKHELQTWVSDETKNLSLLFPLVAKQPSVVVDLSKFGPSGKETEPPMAQFKACTAALR
jgi:dipeptidyl aminopeptidase/acylaminoacyl peptidase